VRLLVHGEVLADQIWLARVVNIARLAPKERRVDDVVLVQLEHVAIADAQFLIPHFSLVCDGHANFLAHILDHNVAGGQILTRKKTVPMDFTNANFD